MAFFFFFGKIQNIIKNRNKCSAKIFRRKTFNDFTFLLYIDDDKTVKYYIPFVSTSFAYRYIYFIRIQTHIILIFNKTKQRRNIWFCAITKLWFIPSSRPSHMIATLYIIISGFSLFLLLIFRYSSKILHTCITTLYCIYWSKTLTLTLWITIISRTNYIMQNALIDTWKHAEECWKMLSLFYLFFYNSYIALLNYSIEKWRIFTLSLCYKKCFLQLVKW